MQAAAHRGPVGLTYLPHMPALLLCPAGIAAAAQDVRHIGDLTFQPAFRHQNRTKPLIAFYLARARIVNRIDNGEEVELTATANQKIISLAGAIAGKVSSAGRQQGGAFWLGWPLLDAGCWPASLGSSSLTNTFLP